MKRLWLAGAVALGLAGAAIAADEGARVSGRVYDWRLAVSNGQQCEERWAFGESGVLTVTSGQEVTTNTYALSPAEGSMFLLQSTRTAGNGLPDCQGRSNASVGATNSIYLQFLNDGGFFSCNSTDTMSCYGVASPIAP
jgi:hypothetical protein